MIFTAVFTFEMILKIIGLGAKEYFKDHFNSFDFTIVIAALLEYIIETENKGVTALRGFRIMRVLKVIKTFKKLRVITNSMINSFKESLNLVMLIITFLFINGLVAKQLFGMSAEQIKKEKELGLYTMLNFDTIAYSVLTIFVCITGHWT
jgi:hypothetical protein